MAERRHPNVVNVSEVEGRNFEQGTRFGGVQKAVGRAGGGRAIGCSWYDIPPGRAAYPFHFHTANEEALYVLEGEGALRLGDATVKVGAGDWIAFPVGPEAAHQLRNTGSTPLRYLCLSTMNNVEVVGYPDSKKVGAVAMPPGAKRGDPPWLRILRNEGGDVGYYDGEDAG